MATRSDSNVRPTRRPAAQSARTARRFALARLLLGIGTKLLLLAVVGSSMPACIIPVGPSWQDPPGDPDSAPQIEDPDPEFFAEVPANPSTNDRTFNFTVTDPNPVDSLWLQLVVDGQKRPFSPGPDIVPSVGDGSLIKKPVEAKVQCTDVDASLPRHIVIAAVGDREFSGTQLLTLSAPGKMDLIGWILDLTCAQGQAP